MHRFAKSGIRSTNEWYDKIVGPLRTRILHLLALNKANFPITTELHSPSSKPKQNIKKKHCTPSPKQKNVAGEGVVVET